MKNLKKILPLSALVLGFALVFTQSAFTPKFVDPNWGYNSTNGQLIDITGKTLDNSENPAPGTYSCLNDGNCAGTFDGPGQPSDLSDLHDVIPGRFRLNN